MKLFNKTLIFIVSLITIFSPLVPTVSAQSQNPQSVNVCFVNLDNAGNVMSTLPNGTSININLYTDPGHLVEGQINSYGTTSVPITQTSASLPNTDLTGSGTNDGYCVIHNFTNDTNHEYTYTQASINSNLDWLPIRYNDEISINYVHPDIAFPYSDEWFDSIAGNEAARNTNADGHITMSSDRQDRTLVIVSQLDQNLPTYAVNFSDTIVGANEYTLSTIPSQINEGQSLNLRLSVTNMGTLKWLSSLDATAVNPVNVSYHWKNLDDDSLSTYNGNRATLNHDIEYTFNDSNIELTVNAPNAPGNYQLIIDLVHEGVTWFSAKGANTYTANIQVGTPHAPITNQEPAISKQESAPTLRSVSPQATMLSAATLATYTVLPYQGGNWHCGGYDCLTGIAEEFYHCSANGIPNDAPDTTDTNVLSTKCWWPIYIQNKWIWDTYGVPYPYTMSQPWNYIQVGWVLEIPDRGGVVIPPPPGPPVFTPVVNISTTRGATIADPFAGLLGTWTGWPQVTFDRWIAWDGAWKDDNIKWSETQRPTAPQLTSIITSNDGNSATIYGVGIPKNFPMKIRVWNEFRYCWACGSAWEYSYQQGTAQNVKIVFFKNNWQYIGEVWNDNPSGRFSINLPKGTINTGDSVFAEVQIEADYTFNNLHWWSDTTETRNFNLRDPKYTGYPYFASGGSGSITVPKFEADLRSNEEKWIDWRATLLGATGVSSITNICGYPAKTYSNINSAMTSGGNGPGAIIFVNGRPIYSFGGTWDTFNYYSDKCTRFGVPTDDPHDGGVGKFNTSGAYQDFQKGRIYWSWKYLGKFTYGTISNKYEQAGGTNSTYGWPTSETYTVNTGNFTLNCQNFEEGTICETNSQTETDPSTIFISKLLSLDNKLQSLSVNELMRERQDLVDIYYDRVNSFTNVSEIELNQIRSYLYSTYTTVNNKQKRQFINALYISVLRAIRYLYPQVYTDLDVLADGTRFIARTSASNSLDDFEEDVALAFSSRKGKQTVVDQSGNLTADERETFYIGQLGDTGFADIYRDSKYFQYDPKHMQSNQIYHLVGGGFNFAYAGNSHCYYGVCQSSDDWMIWHETVQMNLISPSPIGDYGSNWEDLLLSRKGLDFGYALRFGGISRNSLADYFSSLSQQENYCQILSEYPANITIFTWDISCSLVDSNRINGYYNSVNNPISEY